MVENISQSLIGVLKNFNELIDRIQTDEIKNKLNHNKLLRIWAANIGAHKTGQSSLDFPLREASNVKDQILKLLHGLLTLLQETADLLSESEAYTSLEDGELSELAEVNEQIVNRIGSLYQISMLVRRPIRHDRLMSSIKFSMRHFESSDIKHVQDKFPTANPFLTERLGKAITRRRGYLEYQKRHHRKLGQGLARVQELDLPSKEIAATELSQTVATAFQEHEPHIDFEEKSSNSGWSETSYATSLQVQGQPITVPPPPKESADGKPFECPYCFYLITISGKQEWAQHIFKDVPPYLCYK
ncbi:MAG: hypothetical protein M1834_006732 [Cirrosporium novae-zelandiae]|nr:MAG: hypothetical protein M1834_006732 [Cirrosporium novae-zelandiae]